MLKNLSTLEHVIGKNVYRFQCDASSSIAEVREALCEFMKYVGNIEDMAKKAAAEREAALAKETPPIEG